MQQYSSDNPVLGSTKIYRHRTLKLLNYYDYY